MLPSRLYPADFPSNSSAVTQDDLVLETFSEANVRLSTTESAIGSTSRLATRIRQSVAKKESNISHGTFGALPSIRQTDFLNEANDMESERVSELYQENAYHILNKRSINVTARRRYSIWDAYEVSQAQYPLLKNQKASFARSNSSLGTDFSNLVPKLKRASFKKNTGNLAVPSRTQQPSLEVVLASALDPAQGANRHHSLLYSRNMGLYSPVRSRSENELPSLISKPESKRHEIRTGYFSENENPKQTSNNFTKDDIIFTKSLSIHSFMSETAETRDRFTFPIKTIKWWGPTGKNRKMVRIVIENEVMGPTPLVALCNLLILRGELELPTTTKEIITLGFLTEILAERILVMAADIIPEEEKDLQNFVRNLPDLHFRFQLDPLLANPRGFVVNMNEKELFDILERYHVAVRHACCCVGANESPTENGEDRWVRIREYSFWDLLLVHRLSMAVSEKVEPNLNDTSSGKLAMNPDTTEASLMQQVAKKNFLFEDGSLALIFMDETNRGKGMSKSGLKRLQSSLRPGTLSILFYDDSCFATLYKHPNGTLLVLAASKEDHDQPNVVWYALGNDPIENWIPYDASFCPSHRFSQAELYNYRLGISARKLANKSRMDSQNYAKKSVIMTKGLELMPLYLRSNSDEDFLLNNENDSFSSLEDQAEERRRFSLEGYKGKNRKPTLSPRKEKNAQFFARDDYESPPPNNLQEESSRRGRRSREGGRSRSSTKPRRRRESNSEKPGVVSSFIKWICPWKWEIAQS